MQYSGLKRIEVIAENFYKFAGITQVSAHILRKPKYVGKTGLKLEPHYYSA